MNKSNFHASLHSLSLAHSRRVCFYWKSTDSELELTIHAEMVIKAKKQLYIIYNYIHNIHPLSSKAKQWVCVYIHISNVLNVSELVVRAVMRESSSRCLSHDVIVLCSIEERKSDTSDKARGWIKKENWHFGWTTPLIKKSLKLSRVQISIYTTHPSKPF